MKKNLPIFLMFLCITIITSCSDKDSDTRTISNDVLKDKIAGGWAGKMIGVTYFHRAVVVPGGSRAGKTSFLTIQCTGRTLSSV